MNEFQYQLAITQAKQSLSSFIETSKVLLNKAESIEILDKPEYEEGAKLFAQIKSFRKAIDVQRKELIKLPYDYVKRVNAFAKEISKPLDNAETIIKQKLIDYEAKKELERREQEKRAEEERKRLQEQLNKEAQEKGVEAVILPEVMFPKEEKNIVHTESGDTVYTRTVWDFEIVDFAQVPDEYKVIDEKKVRQAINRLGIRDIPGLKIFQKKTIVKR